MAIGVGGGTNQQELHDIASDPDSKFLFDLNSFSALGAIKNQLADILCRGMDKLASFNNIPETIVWE